MIFIEGELKVAIIGGGIVGSTAAYYLSLQQSINITLFDNGVGQATKAAAGIISPWLSKRRNKQWYRLARDGAKLLLELADEANLTKASYHQTGTIITRADQDDLDDLEDLAYERRNDAPTMGEIYRLTEAAIKQLLPFVQETAPGILITGGARIDGAEFCRQLQQLAGVVPVKENVVLAGSNKIVVNGQSQTFDAIVIATGAWLPETLQPLGLSVDVRPQKGQLIELTLAHELVSATQPVLMPEGERDFIPVDEGRLIIGATHENDMGFSLTESEEIENDLLQSANHVITPVSPAAIQDVRVGTRAYTPDFAPFFGALPDTPNIFVASGLGSSGLTTGPLIGKLLADMVLSNEVDISAYTKAISNYVH